MCIYAYVLHLGLSRVSPRLPSDQIGAEVMTINDLCCDVCGRLLAGLAARPTPPASPAQAPQGSAGEAGHLDGAGDHRDGVRFVYHPGKPELRDASGLACQACWDDAVRLLADPGPGRCAACAAPVSRLGSLHLRRYDDPQAWRLCAPHAVDFLNRLRTVQPKLDPATFRFPFG
jgi:hypothetical protein